MLILFILSHILVLALCQPLHSVKSLFDHDCSKPIQQELDVIQGQYPNLNNHAPFGYIYSVSTSPTFKLARDIRIQHQASSSIIKQHEITTWKPLSVAVVLSKVQYIGSISRLILSGHISKSNADRISDASMANLDTMTIQFDTFTYDESNSKWYSKFKSGNSYGISGRVAKIEVVQQRYGKDTYQELSIELLPLPKVGETSSEHFDYSATSILPTAEIKWNGLEAYECQKSYNEKINSAKRKEHFYEVIESAVLF